MYVAAIVAAGGSGPPVRRREAQTTDRRRWPDRPRAQRPGIPGSSARRRSGGRVAGGSGIVAARISGRRAEAAAGGRRWRAAAGFRRQRVCRHWSAGRSDRHSRRRTAARGCRPHRADDCRRSRLGSGHRRRSGARYGETRREHRPASTSVSLNGRWIARVSGWRRHPRRSRGVCWRMRWRRAGTARREPTKPRLRSRPVIRCASSRGAAGI